MPLVPATADRLWAERRLPPRRFPLTFDKDRCSNPGSAAAGTCADVRWRGRLLAAGPSA